MANRQGSAGAAQQGDEDFELLQTRAFVDDLKLQLTSAKTRIHIQLMTFDGDEHGLEIADLLIAAKSRGVDVKVLIDCFTFFRVADTSVRKKSVRGLVKKTDQMHQQLRANGVELKFTHPLGPSKIFSVMRNHKKAFIIDGFAYLGGINVSAHNFSWHDFMIKVNAQPIVAEIDEDFQFTFDGGRRSTNSLIITNTELEGVFDSLVLGATDSVFLASPYALDLPLNKLMSQATAPNKAVVISNDNNLWFYDVISPFFQWRLARHGVDRLTYTAKFSHSKFLIVDDDKLLVGSSNFGRHSFWCNEEICLLITDREFIAQFRDTFGAQDSAVQLGGSLWRRSLGAVLASAMHAFFYLNRQIFGQRVPNLANR